MTSNSQPWGWGAGTRFYAPVAGISVLPSAALGTVVPDVIPDFADRRLIAALAVSPGENPMARARAECVPVLDRLVARQLAAALPAKRSEPRLCDGAHEGPLLGPPSGLTCRQWSPCRITSWPGPRRVILGDPRRLQQTRAVAYHLTRT